VPGGRDTLISSYCDYLAFKGGSLARQYAKRDYEGQLAEAATFRVLQNLGVRPNVADASGGPDFLCAAGPNQFMVEATSFKLDKVSKDTSLPDEWPNGIEGGPFGMLASQLWDRASDKRRQLANIGMPGVLAIASDHVGAHLVLNELAAQYLITSTPFWTLGSDRMHVDFSQSIFLKRDDGGDIIPYNTGISAAILIAVGTYSSYAIGALHPAATHKFKSELLWQIPFAYVKDWPVENCQIRCGWTLGSRPHETPHASIRIE
jgi:hypothetical protein